MFLPSWNKDYYYYYYYYYNMNYIPDWGPFTSIFKYELCPYLRPLHFYFLIWIMSLTEAPSLPLIWIIYLIEVPSLPLSWIVPDSGSFTSINLNYVPDWGHFTSINLNMSLVSLHFHYSKIVWGPFTSFNLNYIADAPSLPLIWILCPWLRSLHFH